MTNATLERIPGTETASATYMPQAQGQGLRRLHEALAALGVLLEIHSLPPRRQASRAPTIGSAGHPLGTVDRYGGFSGLGNRTGSDFRLH